MQTVPYMIAGVALAVSVIGALVAIIGLVGVLSPSAEEVDVVYAAGFLKSGLALLVISAPTGWMIYRFAERAEDERLGRK